jgi:pimeloyl-ACP methyl ester carboxylesterase
MGSTRWELCGRKVFAVSAGSEEPVLLLHGYPQSASCWRRQIAALGDSHRVVAPDWPGFGRSEPPSAATTYDNEVERIEQFVQRLGWQRFNLLAHDYGGFIGLGYVIRHPERVLRFAVLNSRAHGIFRPWFYRYSLGQHWIATHPPGRVRGRAAAAVGGAAPPRLGPLPETRLLRRRCGSRIPGLDEHTARQAHLLGILRPLFGGRRPLAGGRTREHSVPVRRDLGRP